MAVTPLTSGNGRSHFDLNSVRQRDDVGGLALDEIGEQWRGFEDAADVAEHDSRLFLVWGETENNRTLTDDKHAGMIDEHRDKDDQDGNGAAFSACDRQTAQNSSTRSPGS